MPVLGPSSSTAPYTVGYLINRTFDLLLGAAREDITTLANAIGANDVTLTLGMALQRANQSTYIAIDDEVLFIQASQTGGSGQQLTVIRGMKGTVPASHAQNSLIHVNPFFTKYQVRNTLQDEIRSWGPQVFAVKTADIQGTNFVRGYDLGTTLGKVYNVLNVQRQPDTIFDVAPNPQDWPSVKFKFDQQANTTAFPSGQALTIIDPIEPFDSPLFHVVYAGPIDVDTPQGVNTLPFQDADSLLTMGMDNSDLDIAPYGAAWRLAAGREIRRTLTEAMGTVADLQAFPPGYMVKTAQEFKQLRDSRLNDAIERLRAQYPIKRM